MQFLRKYWLLIAAALIVPPRWRAIPHTSRATLADVAPGRRAKGRTLSEDIS